MRESSCTAALLQLLTIYGLLLHSRYPVKASLMATRIERTRKTVQRILDCLRYDFHAPIEYDAKGRGWVLTDKAWRLLDRFEA